MLQDKLQAAEEQRDQQAAEKHAALQANKVSDGLATVQRFHLAPLAIAPLDLCRPLWCPTEVTIERASLFQRVQ